MKIDKMIEVMEREGVSLPRGTGRDGAIMAIDLRNALGAHFFQRDFVRDGEVTPRGQHMALRMRMDPMKAFRYDKLPVHLQRHVLEHESWFAEEKYNGWRIVITYVPSSGFAAFGGNYSDVNFMPIDYTDKILFKDDKLIRLGDERYIGLYDQSFIIDTEVLCDAVVENRKGMFSSSTLDTVGMILSLPPDEARDMQLGGAVLEFKAFDTVSFTDAVPSVALSYIVRRMNLYQRATNRLWPLNMQVAPSYQVGKNAFLKRVWNRGGEGIVLKNVNGVYAPGGRRKELAIKVKRTVSGDIGDDLDCYVTGYFQTPEWEKKGLIGGLELSVILNGEEKVIANVSAMPDEVREQLTADGPVLKEEYFNKVLVVDGQELSARNRMLMHARVDWDRGFRLDKDPEQCILTIQEIESTKF